MQSIIIIHKQRSYNGAFCIVEYNYLDPVWTQEVLYKKFQMSKFHHPTFISENILCLLCSGWYIQMPRMDKLQAV